MKSRTSHAVVTKLAPPQIYTNILPRPRLFQLLNTHTLCRLIVVSAPAGYGKSTFITVWGKQASTELIWVSLDEMDNDETRFWGALVQAVVAIQPSIFRRTMAILHFGERLDSDALTSTLIAELSEYEQDMTIVLDDFHVIHNVSIHRLVQYVIQRIPNHVHVAILSRSVLPFTTARLRAQGQVVEIGMNDLRFTGAEIRGFYLDVLHMNLTESVINEISQMTEGWVSGLQLAAMMMSYEKNLSNPFQRFGGNHQMIAEFLHDEVLKAQPEDVQRFLLETSILNRMTESLCSAVTGIQDASDMLQRLQFTNSFVIALDEERVWFRYHQLFSDFLRHRLGIVNSGRVRELHRRAAAWFELQGFTVDAIEHAIAAEDFTFAARILEGKSEELLHTGELNTLLRWFERIPQHELAHYPLAQILHVWVLALSQRLEPAIRLIDGLRETLLLGENGESDEWTLELDVVRGYIAILQRHTALAVQFFTKSIQYVPKYSRFFSVGMRLNSGEPFVLPSRLGMRGYLRSSFELYTSLREIWKNSGLAILGYGSAALGELYYEWNDLDKLDYFIPRGIELGSTFGDVGILVPMHLLHAKYLRARRMRMEMWQCVGSLEDWIQSIPLNGHWQDIVLAFKVRMWLQENQMDDVASWLDANWENQYGHVTVVSEYGLITMARVLIYVKQLGAAIKLLGKLLQFAEMQDRLASKIEVSLLQAIAYGAKHDEKSALTSVRRAVDWAISEGYQRMFLDEGDSIVWWLEKLRATDLNLAREKIDYVKHLIDVIDAEKHAYGIPIDGSFGVGMVDEDSNTETLTNREHEVLGAIEMGLTNAEIAQELGLTVGTVKIYVHNICSKLGVKNRTHAVAKARSLKVLSRWESK